MELNKNSIEEWAKLVPTKSKRTLTHSETETYIKCALNSDIIDANPKIVEDIEKGDLGYGSVFWKRVKSCHTYKVTPSLCVYLASSILFNFGISTMMANYLQYVAHKHGIKEIGITEWSTYAFPWGVPTEQSWKELWDAQKYEGSNLLDNSEYMESIKDIA